MPTTQDYYRMWDEICPHKKMEKKTEDYKALRLFAEEIERKISYLFLLLNSAQDRLEELMTEDSEESEEVESPLDDYTDVEFNWERELKTQVEDYSLEPNFKEIVKKHKRKRPSILLPEKTSKKKT